jgi:hypothetical protein
VVVIRLRKYKQYQAIRHYKQGKFLHIVKNKGCKLNVFIELLYCVFTTEIFFSISCC